MDPVEERFMMEALKLARRARGYTNPNPMVGAVVVREGRVISRGLHRRFGGPHAEVEALSKAKGDLSASTLYVTLEPCCHYGKTPPCVQLIASKGVGRVVVGTLDPNPAVSGKGVSFLRKRGIEVEVGCLEHLCRDLNRVYFHWREKGVPWVTLKWAQTLDGRIATFTGDSKWISSRQSRTKAHRLRAVHDAVIVGVGTILRDDPQLTVRLVRGRDPKRVVLDSRLRIPLNAKVLDLAREGGGTWVATTPLADEEKASKLKGLGAKVLVLPQDERGRVSILDLLIELANKEISSVLVEGGSQVLTSFLKGRHFQEVVCFLAPKILGSGIEAVGDLGIKEVNKAIAFDGGTWKRCGQDLMVTLRPPRGAA